MGIIALATALILPASFKIRDNFAITSAGQMLQAELALARQYAVARNRTVEVRFYEVPAPSGTDRHFTKFQTWIYDSAGEDPQALTNLQTLPAGTLIDARAVQGAGTASKASSTLIDSAPGQGSGDLPGVTGAVAYRSLSFRGNGATNLGLNGTSDGDTWFLTTRLRTDNPGTAEAPRNYLCLQLDPLTGQPRAFRP